MVDALISAAAESESCLDELVNDYNDDHPPVRFCEFCHSSNTPTWRRGPSGKGSLCNACGIKWRLRKRLKKNEKGSPSPPLTPDKKMSPLNTAKQPKKRKERDVYSRSIKARTDINGDQDFDPVEMKRKKYYCKYCDQTFSFSQFRNSQQFGAHCSNCSRRPARAEDLHYGREDYVYNDRSPETPPLTLDRGVSSPESPASPLPTSSSNPRDGLLLRLLYVVENQLVDVNELEEIRDEITTLKTELITREEARKVELGLLSARFKQDLAELKTGLQRSLAAHEELAAQRLMEMETTIRRDTEF